MRFALAATILVGSVRQILPGDPCPVCNRRDTEKLPKSEYAGIPLILTPEQHRAVAELDPIAEIDESN